MTIVDTIADAHYGDRVALAMAFAEMLNEEARELAAIGVDVIQFDEPAFNVYLDEVVDWGIAALHRAAAGLPCTHRGAYLLRLRHPGQYRMEARRSAASGGNTSGSFRRWRRAGSTRSRSNAPIRMCRSSCLALLAGKDVLVGAIDVASDEAETPEQVAATIEAALRFVPPERLYPCTNCGMAPLDRTLANQKLAALAAGAALVRGRPDPDCGSRPG